MPIGSSPAPQDPHAVVRGCRDGADAKNLGQAGKDAVKQRQRLRGISEMGRAVSYAMKRVAAIQPTADHPQQHRHARLLP